MASGNFEWQKTLRDGFPGTKALTKPGRRSDPVMAPPAATHQAHAIKKERKLSVVEEEDANVQPSQRHPAAVKPVEKKWEVYAQPKVKQEQDPLIKESKKIPPFKKSQSSLSFFGKKVASKKPSKLTCVPEPEEGQLVLPKSREPLLSPIPLPPGVVCIDPPCDEDSTGCYEASFVAYVRKREQNYLFSAKTIIGNSRRLESHRALLMAWILEVSAHFGVSQDTLFLTVSIIDATLSKREVKSDQLQLVALTAFLIAAKLEEYHPPSIRALIELTDDSYTHANVLEMEIMLLRVHDGEVRMTDPMVEINRCLKAALKEEDVLFKQAVLLFYDGFIPSLEYSGRPSVVKVAAAARAALNLLYSGAEAEWTPTLRYYTGCEEKDLQFLASLMTEIVVTEVVKSEEVGKREGLVRKYNSSRHDRLLKKEPFQKDRLQEALKRLDNSIVYMF